MKFINLDSFPPYLLLAQHNTWNDVINLPPVWFSFPCGHHFTGPTRTNYFPEHPKVNAYVQFDPALLDQE